MEPLISKANLLELARAEHHKFDELVRGVADSQMSAPGVEGAWSVRDIAAHLMFWQQRAIFFLECARDGWQPDNDRWSAGSIDERNEMNYQAHKNRSVADVLAELHETQAKFIRLVEATPEQDLSASGRHEFLAGVVLIDRISGETYEHYRDHSDTLGEWRAKQA
jgi:hypothetical protein